MGSLLRSAQLTPMSRRRSSFWMSRPTSKSILTA